MRIVGPTIFNTKAVFWAPLPKSKLRWNIFALPSAVNPKEQALLLR